MEHFLQDLRYSWRLARSSRGSSAFIVLLLALGVGLNVAVFDLTNAVLLRPLPVRDPDRLVRLVTVDPKLGPRSIFTHRTYEVLKEKSTSFTDVIAYSLMSTAARDDSGASSRVWCEVVTGNYFTALGVRPLYGRLLTDADVTGKTDFFPVVLSYQYWQRRFHGDVGVVG
ncbi:MAG: ABC transporter substrate-binding protein, partial [Acidobacteria bacterium]